MTYGSLSSYKKGVAVLLGLLFVGVGGMWFFLKMQSTPPLQEPRRQQEREQLPKPIAVSDVQGAVSGDVPSENVVVEAPATKAIATDDAKTAPLPTPPSPPTPTLPADASEEPPLLLKSVGIDLGNYDATNQTVGDLLFTKKKLQFGVLFSEFGFTIPANQTKSGQAKENPQPTWIVPLGTKVHALVDGVVTHVTKLYSDDYSVMVATDPKSRWMYETEHIINPLVKEGDRVKAGQVVGEVSPHSSEGNSGYGMVEIGILKGGNPPQHVCPFAYLDPSVKSRIQGQLLGYYRAWEAYVGDTSRYDAVAQPTPGCLTLEPLSG